MRFRYRVAVPYKGMDEGRPVLIKRRQPAITIRVVRRQDCRRPTASKPHQPGDCWRPTGNTWPRWILIEPAHLAKSTLVRQGWGSASPTWQREAGKRENAGVRPKKQNNLEIYHHCNALQTSGREEGTELPESEGYVDTGYPAGNLKKNEMNALGYAHWTQSR